MALVHDSDNALPVTVKRRDVEGAVGECGKGG